MTLRINSLLGFGRPAFDQHALAFLAATAISNVTQRRAIDALVKDLKNCGAWDKLRAIYPFIGGTSTTHKYNLKDPQDTDAAFRGVFAGTVTHDANGVTGNGTTGYMDTKFNQSTNGADDDEHVSVYCRSTTAGGDVLSVNNTGRTILILYNTGNALTRSQTSVSTSTANADTLGYHSLNRTASTGYRFRKNATNTNITQDSDVAPANSTFYVLARNTAGTAGQFSDGNLAWAAIGRGLTQTEDDNVRIAVEAYQDRLSRGVV